MVYSNILEYADDLVLLVPSWFAQQELINLLQLETDTINMSCQIKKSCYMFFSPVYRNFLIFHNT